MDTNANANANVSANEQRDLQSDHAQSMHPRSIRKIPEAYHLHVNGMLRSFTLPTVLISTHQPRKKQRTNACSDSCSERLGINQGEL
jgi:hypothetical protein